MHFLAQGRESRGYVQQTFTISARLSTGCLAEFSAQFCVCVCVCVHACEVYKEKQHLNEH